MAQRARVVGMALPLARASAPLTCSNPYLQLLAPCCCSGKGKQSTPPKKLVNVCESNEMQEKQQDKDECEDEDSASDDPCEEICKDKTATGPQQKQAASKDKEECESSESESDKECSDQSSDDEVKAPIKDCPEEEESDSCSDEDEKKSKAATEMCECVKTAVAKAVEQKGVAGQKQQSSIGKPGPCSSGKGKDPPQPKVSEHVQCCNVEKSKSASSGGMSAADKCREERKALDRMKSQQSGGKESLKESIQEKKAADKGSEKKSSKNDPCECIKQALDKCKHDAPKNVSKGKTPDKKTTEDKRCEEKGKNKKPDKKDKKHKQKPGPKKPGPSGGKPKQCDKKKKPVVVCK